MGNILIAYYSRKGENYWNGSIKNLVKGNTEIIAEMIQEITEGELFKIDTVKDYPENYYKCIDVAKEEMLANERPELTEVVDDINKYDVIFLGYPNWWGTMPMPVFTFLESYDMSGKIIVPFCTNEGSGMGSSEHDLKKICPTSEIKKGLPIHGAKAAKSQNLVKKWVEKSL